MANEVTISADKIKKREKRFKILKRVLLLLLLLLLFIYLFLSFVYNGGHFTITLDRSFVLEQGLVLYDDLKYKEPQVKLSAGKIDFMDNISIKWIPSNIDDEADGIHNGDNYIAYTFYVENTGKDTINYWSELIINDVIKNVDDAIRVMIFENGEKTIYGKINALTGQPEKDCEPFFSDDSIFVRLRENIKPNEIDKYTIVIWLEGDDPDCLDDLLGGEIKLHMEIRSEHLEDKLYE